jgi:UDP-N-acetylmuramoyl-tripeptide--D-alanyl-D-alanine ligase
LNAAAAAAVALALGVTPDQIAAGLAKTAPVKMRMSEVLLHGVTYVNDAYNANPQSMAAALDHLAGCLRPSELVLVLGDMLELGAFERSEHRKVLEKVKKLFPEARLVTVGPRFAREASSLNGCPAILCGSAAGAARVLRGLVHPDDTVFLKGSRGMKLEEAIPAADFIPSPKPVDEPTPIVEETPAPVEEEKPVVEEAPAAVEETPVEEEKPAPAAE